MNVFGRKHQNENRKKRTIILFVLFYLKIRILISYINLKKKLYDILSSI